LTDGVVRGFTINHHEYPQRYDEMCHIRFADDHSRNHSNFPRGLAFGIANSDTVIDTVVKYANFNAVWAESTSDTVVVVSDNESWSDTAWSLNRSRQKGIDQNITTQIDARLRILGFVNQEAAMSNHPLASSPTTFPSLLMHAHASVESMIRLFLRPVLRAVWIPRNFRLLE